MTKKAATYWAFGGGSLLLVVFYILSPGPVLRMTRSGGMSSGVEEFLEIFYWPLEKLYNNVEIVERFYDWWFGLWGA